MANKTDKNRDKKRTYDYPLTFQEALENVMSGKGWAQGDGFPDGVIMMCEGGMFMRGKDYLHIHNFTLKSHEQKQPIHITTSLMAQKFRMVSTQPDAERRV